MTSPGVPAPALSALVLLLLLLVLGSVPAHAQQDDGADDGGADKMPIRVEVGYDDSGVSPAWTPVEITFQPDRPVSGELVVRMRDGRGRGLPEPWTHRQPVDAAAGAPVRYDVLVPTGDRLEVQLLVGSTSLAEETLTLDPPADRYLVGMLDADPAGAPSADILPLGLASRWVRVDSRWLGRHEALTSLDSLVVTAEQVRDEATWAVLAAETARGMTLVVVGEVADDAPAALAGLSPDAPAEGVRTVRTRPTADLDTGEPGGGELVAATAPFGLGRLVVSLSAPAALPDGRLWASLVGPRGARHPLADGASLENNPFAAQDLLRSRGLGPQAVAIPFFGVFLLLYVVVAGPVVGVVLRRRGKPEWAWVAVPLVAVLFAGGAAGLARGGGSQELSVTTLTWWVEGSGQERVAAAWTAGTTGQAEARLDGESWAALPWGGQIQATAVTDDREGTSVVGELRRGEIGGVLASRPVTDPPPLVVDAVTTADGVDVAVTNSTGEALRGVEVVLGNRVIAESVDLEPGGTYTTSVDGRTATGSPPPLGPASSGGGFGVAVAGPDMMVEQAIAVEAFQLPDGTFTEFEVPAAPMPDVFVEDGRFFDVSGSGIEPEAVRRPLAGMVWARATLDGSGAPVSLVGADLRDHTAHLVVGAHVRTTPGLTAPWATMPTQAVVHDVGGRFSGQVIARIMLPAYEEGSRLLGPLRTQGFDIIVEVWDDTASVWREVRSTVFDVDPAPMQTGGGEIYVRLAEPIDGIGVALAPPGVTLEALTPNATGRLEPAPLRTLAPVEVPNATATAIPVPDLPPTPVPIPIPSQETSR